MIHMFTELVQDFATIHCSLLMGKHIAIAGYSIMGYTINGKPDYTS